MLPPSAPPTLKRTWNQQGQPGKDAFDFVRYTASRNTHSDNVRDDGVRSYESISLCDAGDRLLFGDACRQDPAVPNMLMQQGEPDLLPDDGWVAFVQVDQSARVRNAIFAQAEAECADSAAPFTH